MRLATVRILLMLGVIVALVFTTGSAASGCTPFGDPADVTTPATGIDITGHGPSGQYYVDNDPCQLDCVISMWIYQESNGIPGIQRADPMVDDTCGGELPADTLVAGVYVA